MGLKKSIIRLEEPVRCRGETMGSKLDSNWKFIIVILLSISLLGCAEQAGLGKPQIKGSTNQWGEVTDSTTEVITKVDVYNPNPVPLPLKNVLTTIYMNDIMMGNGSAVKSEIDTNSNSTIVISTDIQNDRISEWWISHIKNDEESSMVMKGDLVFDLKVTEFKYPIEKTRQVNTDILSGLSVSSQRVDSTGPGSITIESAESQWGEVNHDYTQVVTTVKVQNDYPVDISIEEINYVVEMNGIRLAEDTSDVTRVIEANSEAELSLTTKMMNDKLEEWWVTHIENNESSTLNTTVQAVVEAEDQRFELNLLEQRSQFTTSLLG